MQCWGQKKRKISLLFWLQNYYFACANKGCFFFNSHVSEEGRVHMGQANQRIGEDGVSMRKMRMSSRNDSVSFLIPSSPASLSFSLRWITERQHLVAVISQTKLFFTLAVSPPKHFFFIKGGPKQNTNKVLLTFYNGNKTRPGSYPPTGLFRWTHFTSILQLGERKLKGELKLKRKGKEGRGTKLLAPPSLINSFLRPINED